jgi:histidinol dehydrogenase
VVVTVATPPQKNGSIPDVMLAAAAIAGADRILVAAGVPALAALAYGTDSVARVEKLAGPGNRFVTVAKKLLYGKLDLDLLAGPSEIVIIADDSADPDAVALDLCGQAEQDPACLPLVITPSEELAKKVREKLAELLKSQPRRELVQAALLGGGIMMVESLDEAVRLAERVAPSLLMLAVRDPGDLLPHIRRAGLVLMGHATPPGVALSQSGICPVLPTTATARHSSLLSANFFRRTLNVIRYNEAALKREGPAATRLAQVEGHLAQAEAIRVRMK